MCGVAEGEDKEYALWTSARAKALRDRNHLHLAQGPLPKVQVVLRNPDLLQITLSCNPAVLERSTTTVFRTNGTPTKDG